MSKRFEIKKEDEAYLGVVISPFKGIVFLCLKWRIVFQWGKDE